MDSLYFVGCAIFWLIVFISAGRERPSHIITTVSGTLAFAFFILSMLYRWFE